MKTEACSQQLAAESKAAVPAPWFGLLLQWQLQGKFAAQLHTDSWHALLQLELSRNRCRDKRIDVWPRAVDTTVFNPSYRSHDMRVRMTDGNPDATILTYVGRLGAGGHAVEAQHRVYAPRITFLQPNEQHSQMQ